MIGYTLEEHTKDGVTFASLSRETLDSWGFDDMAEEAVRDLPVDKGWSGFGCSSDIEISGRYSVLYILRSHYLLPIVAA